MSKVGFVGGGSFGISLGILLANKGNDVTIFDKDVDVVYDINVNRKNDRYIKDLNIPENLQAFNTLEEAIANIDYLVLAVPSHIIRMVSRSLKGKLSKDVPIVTIAKGIEEGTDIRLSEVINEELPNEVVVLSGPSHAEEVALGIPTTLVATSKNMDYAKEIQNLFMNSYLRVYTNEDIIGVEIGGAVKNIIALAAGVIDGLGYGDNTKAALMTRGMKEISRIGVALGGKEDTFYGLTGMGDLIVTCTSMHSRNRRAGILIGSGKSLDEAVKEIGMVVEGVKACKAFYELKEKMDVEMPITDTLYKVLFQSENPKEGIKLLMERNKKDEMH